MATACVWSVTTLCQAQGEFDPENPPDPNPKTRVTVGSSPAGVARVSGYGDYDNGQNIYIHTWNYSSENNYQFSYWTINGYRMDEASDGFYYTVADTTANFVAHWVLPDPEDFNPENPGDPPDVTDIANEHKLFVKISPEDGAYLNNFTSGSYVLAGQTQHISITPKTDFVVNGWFYQGSNLTTGNSLDFEMPARSATITISLSYSPDSPADPEQDPNLTDDEKADIDNGQNGLLGDLNGDGSLSTVDVVRFINLYLAGDQSAMPLSVCDCNKDGKVNLADIITLINLVLAS